jgi:DNA-binding transcriptional regulator LsrR (DeoR family)
VARRLALRLRTEFSGPDLVLHALSSGFDITDPLRAPVAFFGSFQNLPMKVDYFGLFVSAAVPWNMYEDVKTQPGVRESFEHAPEVDIVVTSLASAADEHGALNRFLRHWSNEALGDLMRQGWVGDVQYLPYSTKAPITVGSGVRAVTLFELADLVAMVRSGDKHVVLIGGPCGECAVSKTEALRPLLEEPNLRVWSHLVLDSGTAEQLLEPAARL